MPGPIGFPSGAFPDGHFPSTGAAPPPVGGSAKDFLVAAVTGGTVYCIVRQEGVGSYLDADDGTFDVAPPNPYLPLQEDAIMRGLYRAAESRSTWADGLYVVCYYRQAGANPTPASDTILEKEIVMLWADGIIRSPDNAAIAALQVDTALLLAFIRNKKYLEKVGAAWFLVIRNADDTADILRKALKGPDGTTEITDIQAAALGMEMKTTV